jgi:hypothetical protein
MDAGSTAEKPQRLSEPDGGDISRPDRYASLVRSIIEIVQTGHGIAGRPAHAAGLSGSLA